MPVSNKLHSFYLPFIHCFACLAKLEQFQVFFCLANAAHYGHTIYRVHIKVFFKESYVDMAKGIVEIPVFRVAWNQFVLEGCQVRNHKKPSLSRFSFFFATRKQLIFLCRFLEFPPVSNFQQNRNKTVVFSTSFY